MSHNLAKIEPHQVDGKLLLLCVHRKGHHPQVARLVPLGVVKG